MAMIEKPYNYTAPSMGPFLYTTNEKDHKKMLYYVLCRLTELEKSTEPVSVLEYFDFSSYAGSYSGNLDLEKESKDFHFQRKLERILEDRLEKLKEIKNYIIDLPKEQEFGRLGSHYLYIDKYRSSMRSKLYYIHQEYLKNELTSEEIDLFNKYIQALIDQQIFRKDDLCRVFGDLPLNN
jgi:hypothetical protein